MVLRRSACSRSSLTLLLFGLAALFCVAWVRADASVNSRVFLRESFISIPTSSASPLYPSFCSPRWHCVTSATIES